MRTTLLRTMLAFTFLAAAAPTGVRDALLLAAQSPELWAGMRWRGIGPTRAGRTRAQWAELWERWTRLSAERR